EGGRRQLLLIARDDELAAAQERRDRVRRGHLRCLVEDDDIEIGLRRQQLADDERAHRPARLEGEQDIRRLAYQVSDRHMPALQPRLMFDDVRLLSVRVAGAGGLLGTKTADPRRRGLEMLAIAAAEVIDRLLVRGRVETLD